MATHQQIRSIPPVNREVWAFSLGGLVRHPLSLSFADLAALPAVTQTVSVICTTRQSIDTAEYTGVPVSALLDLVEIDPSAQAALLHGYDGYSATLKLHELRERALIAYAVNGQPLTHDQGYPARIVVPGRWGYKHIKWGTRIELTDQARGGTWESNPEFKHPQGNSPGDLAIAITGHEHLTNSTIRIHGFLYADPAFQPKLFLNIDHTVQTEFPLTPGQTAWHVDWTPPYSNGVFSVTARAYNATPNRSSTFADYVIRT